MLQTSDETTAPAPWLPVTAVAVTLVLWASAFVAIRHLADDFTAGPLSLGRLVVGSAALAVPALSRGVPRPTPRQWATIAAIGVLWFGVYNVALNEGERRIDAGTSAMLVQVSPVLIAVLAALFLSERFTRQLAVGLALAFAGVAVIALTGSPGGDRDVLGAGLCLLAAVVYSVSLVLQKPLVARLLAVHVVWLACSVGAVACLPFAPALVRELGDAPASSVGWLAYLGVFPTAIAFTTYAYALRHMTASRLGVTTYVVPVLATGMSGLFLGEVPPPLAYVGGALALVGVSVARRTSGPQQSGPVTELVQVRPQRFEHAEGWAVSNAGREEVAYEEGGRSALVGIDRGRPSSRLYVDTLVWVDPDGAEVPVVEPERSLVLDRIVEGLEEISSATIERFSSREQTDVSGEPRTT